MNKLVVAVALLCACATALNVSVSGKKCSFIVQESNNQNYIYDLSEIGEVWVEPDEGTRYTLNLCDGVSSGCSSSAAVCMSDNTKNEYVNLGSLSTRSTVSLGGEEPGEGVVVLFGQGDPCPDGVFTSTVLVLCDPTAKKPEVQVLPDECDYSFQIISDHGCGKVATSSEIHEQSEEDKSDESGTDSGEVVAIVILVLLLFAVVLYFALGAVWQKKKNDASTFSEYIIHREFWTSIPGLVIDGCKFIGHGFKKGDYVAV